MISFLIFFIFILNNLSCSTVSKFFYVVKGVDIDGLSFIVLCQRYMPNLIVEKGKP